MIDLALAPFLDDGERAEVAWLLARDARPDARPPSSRIANEYAELEYLLASLPSGSSDDRWHGRVLKATGAAAFERRIPRLRATLALTRRAVLDRR